MGLFLFSFSFFPFSRWPEIELSARRQKSIFRFVFYIRVHCLANTVWHGVCCHSYVECPHNHCLPESAQFSQAQHVLVINQVFADMFVGSCEITRFCFLGKRCKFWTINILNFPNAIAFHACCRCILLASAANRPCCYFHGADAHNVNFVHSSIVSSKGKCLEQLLQPFGLYQGSAQQSLS